MPLFVSFLNLISDQPAAAKVQASSLVRVYSYRARVLRQRTHNLEVFVKFYFESLFTLQHHPLRACFLDVVHNSFAVPFL